jgi:hypothetical protein
MHTHTFNNTFHTHTYIHTHTYTHIYTHTDTEALQALFDTGLSPQKGLIACLRLLQKVRVGVIE